MPRWSEQDVAKYAIRRAAVGAVDSKVGKHDTAAALVCYKPRQPNRKGSLAIVVTIIPCRNRLCDSDNSGMGGCKALRDAIAESLGIDDGSERIRFEYAQAHTTGEQGTIVKIELLKGIENKCKKS